MNLMQKRQNSFEKCKKIKLVLTDVDGVLTDGSRYFSLAGEKFKKFHVRDGMGVNILLRNGIKTVIITKEKSKIVEKWGKEMNVSKILMNVKKKELEIGKICSQFKVRREEIAFIGDDVNDTELMKKVGFAAAPNDAVDMAKKYADFTCKKNGGRGAFRELVDLILIKKFSKRIIWTK